MAGKDSEDEKLTQAIAEVEQKDLKVISKAEYEHLMGLLVAKEKAPSATSEHLTSTPGASFTSKKCPSMPPQRFQTPPPFSPISRLQLGGTSNPLNASLVTPSYNVPKLPFFSGSEEPQKGETTYEVWNFEVKCLLKSQQLPEHVLLQSIRNSLKGSARNILVPLGEDASVEDILNKLDGFYGNVCSSETLIQSFYSDYQKDKESIVEYGSRLEQTLSRAIRYGHIDLVAKDAMLRSKFWTGLNNQHLKHSTRHLYDSIKDFQSLLKEVRKVEQEEIAMNRPPVTTSKQKVAQQNVAQSSNEAEDTNSVLLKQMTELMGRMKAMEKKLETQQQALSAANSQASSQLSDFQPQFSTRGRGRGFNRGFNRGYRGTYGRGNQGYFNSGNENQGSFGGRGGFRGGRRGGTSGRGANRGGRGTDGTKPLNY
ncbi:MAG: hypothetical protein N0E59_21415 [Candidatus Thiodiazotropha taylori]|nr:hypothetical protein [Candidatus Thiodiazotropha taylori]MCW4285680.1 hypothetical protein [Candidatus Thiodiazotropha taylori]